MSAPRVVLHVGLPKTGTSFVQSMLRENAGTLVRHDVHLAETSGQSLFPAVLYATGRSEGWGRSVQEGERAWERLGAWARTGTGVRVISSETLCLAGEEQITRMLEDLRPAQVDVVVTLRDLARQIPAEWQEGVKHGRRWPYAAFLDTVLDDPPQQAGRRAARERFWRAQDPVGVLDRWASHVGHDRVRVVVSPAAGGPREELWRRFARATGLSEVAVTSPDTPANTSLGRVQVEVLRRVNRRVTRRGNETTYGEVVKRLYAGTVLRGQGGEKILLPESRVPEVQALARGWAATIAERGYDVSGDLDDLVPGEALQDAGAAPSSSQMLDAALDATVELLREVERLRKENARLRGRGGVRSDLARSPTIAPITALRRGLARVGGRS